MTLSVFGDQFYGGQLSTLTKWQMFAPNNSIALRYIKTWVILFNDPTFSALVGKIYADDENASTPTPSTLISTSSNSFDIGDIITTAGNNSAWKEIYFRFSDVLLKSGTCYYFSLQSSSYSYSPTSHIAWAKGWPDPVYDDKSTSRAEILNAPYQIAVIGGLI